MFIAQSLDTSSESKNITNKVTRHFLFSLYAPMVCTLIRVSISGLGVNEKKKGLSYFLLELKRSSVAAWSDFS